MANAINSYQIVDKIETIDKQTRKKFTYVLNVSSAAYGYTAAGFDTSR